MGLKTLESLQPPTFDWMWSTAMAAGGVFMRRRDDVFLDEGCDRRPPCAWAFKSGKHASSGGKNRTHLLSLGAGDNDRREPRASGGDRAWSIHFMRSLLARGIRRERETKRPWSQPSAGLGNSKAWATVYKGAALGLAVLAAGEIVELNSRKTEECRASVPPAFRELEERLHGRRLCKTARAWERAMATGSSFKAVTELLKDPAALDVELVRSVLDKRSTEEKVKGLTFLLAKEKTPEAMVLHLSCGFSEKIGPQKLLEVLNAAQAFDTMFFYLKSIVDGSNDPFVHTSFIEAAVTTKRYDEAERLSAASALYDAAKVEKALLKAKLPGLRALVHVWVRQGRSPEDITSSLHRTRRAGEYLQAYVSEVAPENAARVLGMLLDERCKSKTFVRVLDAVGARSPVDDIAQQLGARGYDPGHLKRWREGLIEKGSRQTAEPLPDEPAPTSNRDGRDAAEELKGNATPVAVAEGRAQASAAGQQEAPTAPVVPKPACPRVDRFPEALAEPVTEIEAIRPVSKSSSAAAAGDASEGTASGPPSPRAPSTHPSATLDARWALCVRVVILTLLAWLAHKAMVLARRRPGRLGGASEAEWSEELGHAEEARSVGAGPAREEEEQLRVVSVGAEIADMLRKLRADGVQEKAIGADGGRQQEGDVGGGEELLWGVHMDIVVQEGVVRIRGGEEELDRAERLIREFQAEDWTTEVPVALNDEDVLMKKGLLWDVQSKAPGVDFQFRREGRVVVVRGRRNAAARVARLLQATVHGGGLDGRGAAVLRVSLVPLAPSGVKLLTARGRSHLKKLGKDTGADFDVLPAASVVRVRARHSDTAAAVVAEAKRALLRLVGGHQTEVSMDLAAVGSSWSPLPPPPPLPAAAASLSSRGGGRGGGKRRAAPTGPMQAVMGSNDSDDDGGGGVGGDGGGGGGGGGGASIARKAGGTSNRSVSKESLRRTVELHGCEVEFVAAPPSTGGKGGGGGESGLNGANGNRDSGASSRAEAGKQQRQTSEHNNHRRQYAGRGGGTAAAAATAATSASVQSATTRVVTAPWNTQSGGVSIKGPPGLVENARNALTALVLGLEESEVSLSAGTAPALEPGKWRKVQESNNNVSITPDSSRCSLKVSGPPAAVEVYKKDLYAMLGAEFPGQFHVVPIPREALREIATPLDLAAAAAAATPPGCDRRPVAVAETAEVLGPVGAAAAAAGWIGEWNVQLLADWPCACVCVRGDAAAVRVAVEAIYAGLSRWSALEVTAAVESWMVPALFGKQGKAIKKLSQSMGGVFLKVRDGVCRGRATSAQAAREATGKLEQRLSELRARRAVVRVSPEAASKLKARGGSSIEKLRERTRATIEMEKEEVTITGSATAVAAAKREVEALTRGLAAQAHRQEQNTHSALLPRSSAINSAARSHTSSVLPSPPPGEMANTAVPPPNDRTRAVARVAAAAAATRTSAGQRSGARFGEGWPGDRRHDHRHRRSSHSIPHQRSSSRYRRAGARAAAAAPAPAAELPRSSPQQSRPASGTGNNIAGTEAEPNISFGNFGTTSRSWSAVARAATTTLPPQGPNPRAGVVLERLPRQGD